MRNSKTIEKEVADLQARREVVAEAHAHAGSGLQAARTALVKGKGSTEEVAAAQGAYTGLDGTLADADGMLADLRAELEAARATEQREAIFFRMAEVAATGNQHFAEFERLRAEANEQLKAVCASLVAAYFGMRQSRVSFLAEATQLVPHVRRQGYAAATPEEEAQLRQLTAELERRGVDLRTVSAEWLGGKSGIDTWPRITELEPFGLLLDTAMQIMSTHLMQQEAEQKAA